MFSSCGDLSEFSLFFFFLISVVQDRNSCQIACFIAVVYCIAIYIRVVCWPDP